MYRPVKRVLGFLLSLLAILVLSPVLLALWLLVRLTSKGPAIFKQKRVGAGSSFFMIYKFRTMRTDAPKDVPTHMLKDPAAMITPLGKFLRKTSLDELPQLFNILKGDMALVGPRPALWNQDDLVAEREKYGANAVLPGLTGLAQVMGRDELPIPVKAKYDGEYVKKMSFVFDAKIIFMTVKNVFTGSGVREGAQANVSQTGGEP